MLNPSAPLPTLYNPVEVAKEMLPQKHEELQRKLSASSLPRPPVSNVASGWNDPPSIMLKSKTSQSQLTSQKLITHPIFGTNPEPVQPMPMGISGMPPMSNSGMPPMGISGMPPMTNSGMSPMNNSGMPPMGGSGMPMGNSGMPMGNSGMQMGNSGMPGAPPGQFQNPSAAAYGGPASMPPPPPTAASHPYQHHAAAVPPPPMVGQGMGQPMGMGQGGQQFY